MVSIARLSFIALVFALTTSIGSGQQKIIFGERVHGGKTALPGEFPFMASLEKLQGSVWKGLCGGSIIGQRHILTAAHCVRDRQIKKYRVKLGCHIRSKCNNVYGLSKIIIHPEYDTKHNDIAILELDRPIRFNQAVGSGSIGKIILNKELLEDENWGDLTVIGWGDTEHTCMEGSDPLMKVNIDAIPFLKCEKIFPRIREDEMCAGRGNRDSCYGDSGGPLFKTFVNGFRLLVGIVSEGDDCGFGGIYVRVASHYSWIKEHLTS